jgi:hypothetical protein
MQQFLKPAVGAVGREVVAAELLEEFLVTVEHAVAAADMGFVPEPFHGVQTDLIRRDLAITSNSPKQAPRGRFVL